MVQLIYKKQKKYLNTLHVLFEDTSELSSEYFNIHEIPSILKSGKNLITILGKRNKLVPNTKVNIEILDVNGDTIYYEVPNIKGEDNSRYIIPYIFDTTPIGIGKIILTGVAKYDLSGKLITGKWKNIQNFRWSKDIGIDRTLRNNSDILFKSPPALSVDRVSNVYYTITQPSNIVYNTGYVSYEIANNKPYLLSRDFEFISDMLNASVSIDSPNIGGVIEPAGFYTSIKSVEASNKAEIADFYDTNYKMFGASNYSMIYSPSKNRTELPSVTKQYLKLTVNNIDLLSGDVYRSRLYFKDNNYDSRYELLDDFIYENKSLLLDYTDPNNIINYGLFDSSSKLSYWDAFYENEIYSSTYITESINNIFNLNSVLLESTYKDKDIYMLYKQDISISYRKNIVCFLDFNVFVDSFESQNLYIDVYLSGSAFITDNPLGIPVLYSKIEKSSNNYVCNIIPNNTGDGNLIFKLRSDRQWYINNIAIYSKINEIHSPQSYTKLIAVPTDHLSSSLSFKLEYFDYENTQAIETTYYELSDSVTYTPPALDLILDVIDKSGIIFELGEVVDIALTSSFIKNDAGSVSSRNIKRDSTIINTDLSEDNIYHIDNSTEIQETIIYSTTVNYSEGPIKNNSIGDPSPYGHIAAGSLTDYAYVYGRYRIFAGVSSSYQETNIDNDWIRDSNNYQQNPLISSTPLTFNIAVSDEDIFTWIVTPIDRPVQSIKLVQSSNAEIIGSFDSTIITIKDGGGVNDLEYNLYYEKLVIPNSYNVTYSVLIP